MNGMRRFFLALYSLLLIAACGGLIVLAWNEEQMLDLQVRDFNVVAFIDAPTSHQAAFTAMLAPFILLGLITFVIALVTPAGGAGGKLRLPSDHVVASAFKADAETKTLPPRPSVTNPGGPKVTVRWRRPTPFEGMDGPPETCAHTAPSSEA